jgi:hypothetical protein
MVNLLLEGRLPGSWIPPAHILELRALVRLRKTSRPPQAPMRVEACRVFRHVG